MEQTGWQPKGPLLRAPLSGGRAVKSTVGVSTLKGKTLESGCSYPLATPGGFVGSAQFRARLVYDNNPVPTVCALTAMWPCMGMPEGAAQPAASIHPSAEESIRR